MVKNILLFIVCFNFFFKNANAQNAEDNPKLVVGIVIDQMRWDYLYRFGNNYSNDGFKRMLNSGYSFENTYIPYLPTYTAVGHTSVYTGSVPAIHGIAGNNWYERSISKKVYCTDDSTVTTVGSNTSQGKMSPVNMWVTTVSDELRLSTNFKSKVIGVSIKDRGSILPAGHSANAAYWYDDKEGKWISSSYYMNELPAWVKKINNADEVAQYMSKDWNLLLDKQKYLQSDNDANDFEGTYHGQKNNSFPYDLN
ncbi:MAG TPA: alkaline phosphatase family protein, partial [Ferruginibacter sp.]|nr:alkaline phosphatase family protein [Ferruginibacter sp.]